MLNLLRRMFFIAFVCLAVSSCEQDENWSEENEKPINEIKIEYNAIELELLKLVNEYRLSSDLIKLESSGLVSLEATTHSEYMVEQAKASHDNFNVRVNNLTKNSLANSVAENIGYGYASTSALMNAWLNNEGHKRAIEGAFTHFGISAKADAGGRYYITQIFIER